MAQERLTLVIEGVDNFTAAFRQLQTQLGAAEGAAKVAAGGFSSFQATLISAQAAIGLVNQTLRPLTTAFQGMVSVAADFETSMNTVRVLTGATGAQFDVLTQQAIQLGATTQFSATQAAEAMGFLGQAGFTTEQIFGAMPATLALAASAQMGLGEAADTVASIMAGFGMEVADLDGAVDVLTAGFVKTNTDLHGLGEAMKFVGPVANAMGLSFEETTAAIGLLSNAGIKGEMAGTALRGAITRLITPTDEAAGVMVKLGLGVMDGKEGFKNLALQADGSLKPLNELLTMLQTEGMSAADAMELFGQRAGPAMIALLEQGAPALVALTANLDAPGIAAEVGGVRMQGFNGAMETLRGAVESLAIAIAQSGLLVLLTSIVTRVSGWVEQLSKADPDTLKFIATVAALGAALAPILVTLGVVVVAVGALLSPLGLVVLAIVGAGGIIATLVLFGDAIQRWFVDKFRAAVDAVSAGVEQVKGFFTDLWQTVVGGSTVPDMVTGVISWFERMAKEMGVLTQEGVDAVNEALDDVEQPEEGTDWGGIAGGAGQRIGGGIAGVGGAIQGFQLDGPMGAVAGFFTELLMKNEKMQELLGKISEVLVKLMDPIAEALAPSLEALVPVLVDLAPVFRLIGHALGAYLVPQTLILRALHNLMVALDDFLKKLWAGIVDVAEPIVAMFANILAPARALVAWLTSVMPAVIAGFLASIDFLRGLPAAIMTNMMAAFNWIADQIRGTVDFLVGRVEGAFVWLRDSLFWIVDQLIGWLRWIGDIFDQVGSFIEDLVDALSGGFFGLQHGGALGAGQRALVGEAGPELFVPASAGAVLPNEALRALAGGGATVNVYALDPRAAAQEIVRVLEEQAALGRFKLGRAFA